MVSVAPAHAATRVDLELVLAVDASGSISDREFALQMAESIDDYGREIREKLLREIEYWPVISRLFRPHPLRDVRGLNSPSMHGNIGESGAANDAGEGG